MKKTANIPVRRSERKSVVEKAKLAEEKKANLKRLGNVLASDGEESYNDGIANNKDDDSNYEYSGDDGFLVESDDDTQISVSNIHNGDTVMVWNKEKSQYEEGEVVQNRMIDQGSERKKMFRINFINGTSKKLDLSSHRFKKKEERVIPKRVTLKRNQGVGRKKLRTEQDHTMSLQMGVKKFKLYHHLLLQTRHQIWK